MLLINYCLFFSGYVFSFSDTKNVLTEPADYAVLSFLLNFVFGKAMTVLAVLIGMGIYLKETKNAIKYDSPLIPIRNRMFWLIFLGIIHMIFFWFGDILFHYGIAGLIFLMMLKYARKYLIFCFLFYTLIVPLGGNVIRWYFFPDSLASVHELSSPLFGQSSIAGFLSRDLEIIFRTNLEVAMAQPLNPAAIDYVLVFTGYFSLGYLLAKRSWLTHRKNTPIWIIIVAVCGLITCILFNYFDHSIGRDYSLQSLTIDYLLNLIEMLSVSILLIFVVGFVCEFEFSRFLKTTIGSVGKMSLSNYLLQTIIALIIFYGLGYMNKISLFQCFILCLVIYAFQVLLSYLILKKFKTGPVERLYNKLSWFH